MFYEVLYFLLFCYYGGGCCWRRYGLNIKMKKLIVGFWVFLVWILKNNIIVEL